MFMCVRAPSGLMYAAVSSVHDMYMSTHLTDDTIDTPPSSHPLIGQVLVSATKGRSWTTLHDLGKPTVWISLDPTNSSRLFVSVANSLIGRHAHTVEVLGFAFRTEALPAVPLGGTA